MSLKTVGGSKDKINYRKYERTAKNRIARRAKKNMIRKLLSKEAL